MKIPIFCAQNGSFVTMADVAEKSAEMLRGRAYWGNLINIPVPAAVSLVPDEREQSTTRRHAEVGVVMFRLPTGHSIHVGLTHDSDLLAKEPMTVPLVSPSPGRAER